MATTYFPRLPHPFLQCHPKQSPWLSPYRLPKARRANQTRYAAGITAAWETQEIHAYADASKIGIGFSHHDKWRRWIFNTASTQPPLPTLTNKIDCNWAELLAVYLALHTLVGLGHHASRVVLYSDSMAVVGMFERLACFHPCLWGILGKENALFLSLLRRIGELVERHGLKVKVRWVPTEENPADGPSRGKGLLKEKRLEHGMALPADLIDILMNA